MKQILVTGSDGQVGTELIRLAKRRDIPLITTIKFDLDITKISDIQNCICKYNPGLVINAAAYTDVDKAEDEIDKAFSVNRDGLTNLAKACQNTGIPLLHISTNYVFDGMKEYSYQESDIPKPMNVYGKSKLEGEEAILKIIQQHIILRTSWVFSSSGQNFPKTMLRLAAEHDTLNIVNDQFGGPTWAGDIARVLLDISSNYMQSQNINWGVYHYTGIPVTNRFEFAKSIFEEAKRLGMIIQMPNCNAISSGDYPTVAKRPTNSVLDCQKIHQELSISQPDWRVGLYKVLNNWKAQ